MSEQEKSPRKLDDESVENVTGGMIDGTEGSCVNNNFRWSFYCYDCKSGGTRDYKPDRCPHCWSKNITVALA